MGRGEIAMTHRRHMSKWMGILTATGLGILANNSAAATTVAISRMNDGVVCSGWAVNPNIVATAAHCVLTPGYYSVSAGDQTYRVMRIWLHPEFSPELLYLTLFKEDFHHDIAILWVVQRDFSVDEYDHMKDKTLLPGASLFAVRAKVPERQNVREIEDLAYARLEFTKKGIGISNDGKEYDICPDDWGAPLFAKIADRPVVVGIIVGNARPGNVRGNMRLERMRSDVYCGNEVRVIDAAVILELLHSIRQRPGWAGGR